MRLPISREDESHFPGFASYEEAKMYFSERFGSDFILQDIEDVGGQQCFFHAVVVDWENYKIGQLQFSRGEAVTGLDYISSYQPVQIMQDGSVHVVY